MSKININNIAVLNSTAPFLDKILIEIQFECIEQPEQDLEFSLFYVGHSTNPEWDQELDTILVGPVPVGVSKFVMETKGPNPERLNPEDVIDYTAMYLKCLYKNQEYLRCSYLIKAEYNNEILNANPPPQIDYNNLVRFVSNQPRVTRFPILWDNLEEEKPPEQPEADNMPALNMDDLYGEDEEVSEEEDNDNTMAEEEVIA